MFFLSNCLAPCHGIVSSVFSMMGFSLITSDKYNYQK